MVTLSMCPPALHLSSHIQRLSFHYYDLYYVEPRPTYLLTSRTISRTTTFRSPMLHNVLFLTGLLNTRYFDNRGLPWSVALSVYVHHILIVQTIERLSARRLFSCMTGHYVWHTVQHVLYPLALSLNWMSRTVTMSYDNWLSAYYVNKFIKTSRNSSNKPLPLAVGSSIMIRQLGEFCRVSGVMAVILNREGEISLHAQIRPQVARQQSKSMWWCWPVL